MKLKHLTFLHSTTAAKQLTQVKYPRCQNWGESEDQQMRLLKQILKEQVDIFLWF